MALSLNHLAVFLVAVSAAYGLVCYKCDSSTSSFCNYGLTSFTYDTVDCSNENGGSLADTLTSWVPKECVKVVAKGKNGQEYVARGCVPKLGGACNTIVKTLSFFSNVDGGVEDMSCYTCNGDKCNSATKLGGFTLVGLIMASIVFLL